MADRKIPTPTGGAKIAPTPERTQQILAGTLRQPFEGLTPAELKRSKMLGTTRPMKGGKC